MQYIDGHILLTLTRRKASKSQTISIFPAMEFELCSFHSLASQLIANPYCTSLRIFDQLNPSINDEINCAAYVNRIFKNIYNSLGDQDMITNSLQSQSARRGAAARAASSKEINLSEISHRGLWSLDGFATILEYFSPTSYGDQKVGCVLAGWGDHPTNKVIPPTLQIYSNSREQSLLLEFSYLLFKFHENKIKNKLLLNQTDNEYPKNEFISINYLKSTRSKSLYDIINFNSKKLKNK